MTVSEKRGIERRRGNNHYICSGAKYLLYNIFIHLTERKHAAQYNGYLA
jgi:hypothetical protein